jgi:hypothetical protein
MTANAFRKLALGLQGVVEGSHMSHPDFRVNNRIFATLQAGDRGMIRLTPEQQAQFVDEYPAIFAPESGAWGRQGCTRVHLPAADVESVGEAMTLAWRDAVAHATTPRRRARKARR